MIYVMHNKANANNRTVQCIHTATTKTQLIIIYTQLAAKTNCTHAFHLRLPMHDECTINCMPKMAKQ